MEEGNSQTAKRQKHRIFVPDTSVLLNAPDLIYKLGNAETVIAAVVIRELDGHKKSESAHIAWAAREVSRTLDRLSSYADLAAGVKLPTGGTLRVESQHDVINALASDADNRILGTALKLKREKSGTVTLLTTDTNMRIIARQEGLKAEFYPFGMDYELAMKLLEENRAAGVVSYDVPAEVYMSSSTEHISARPRQEQKKTKNREKTDRMRQTEWPTVGIGSALLISLVALLWAGKVIIAAGVVLVVLVSVRFSGTDTRKARQSVGQDDCFDEETLDLMRLDDYKSIVEYRES